MRVVVSGGGTGGHIFPALAVIESLHRLDTAGASLYIGATTGMETEIVPARGVPFRAITAKKLRKVLSPSTLGVLISLWKGYGEAKRHLREWKAEAVVGTGGYVAAATVMAGAQMGLPTLILAPDLIPGRTNRLLARRAKKICVVFDATVAQFPAGHTEVTGLPLREGIVLSPEVTQAEARCAFAGLAPDRLTVLVVGGSQGARTVNRLVVEATGALVKAGIQVLHATGVKNLEEVRLLAQQHHLEEGAGYVTLPFLNEMQMPQALRAADMMVCRGGISTLSEGMANGLPALIIPLPTAYADHQTANAKALEASGAALHRAERDLTGSLLAEDLLQWARDTSKRQTMAERSRALGKPQAADTVARMVLGLGKGAGG